MTLKGWRVVKPQHNQSNLKSMWNIFMVEWLALLNSDNKILGLNPASRRIQLMIVHHFTAQSLWLHCTKPLITLHKAFDYTAQSLWLYTAQSLWLHCTKPLIISCTKLLTTLHKAFDYIAQSLWLYPAQSFWLHCTKPLITLHKAFDYTA